MRASFVPALYAAAIMMMACSGNRSGNHSQAGAIYERDCDGTAFALYETVDDTPALVSRVAMAMTKEQLLRLEHLVAQGSVTSAVLGYAEVGDTAALNRLMEEPNIAGALQPDVRLLWAAEPETNGTATLIPLYALKIRDGMAAQEGRLIQHAAMTKAGEGESFAIAVTLTDAAADGFAVLTRSNIGRQIAVVIDGKVVMAPFVQSEITGGNILITLGAMNEGRVRALMDRL